MKVMVVDDEQSLLRALELIFSNAGFEYIGICQSTKALEAIEDHRPDVVILDVMMPGINGFELCEAIRNRQPEMPILMLSAKCDIVDRHVGLRAGADDYLAKPFDDEECCSGSKPCCVEPIAKAPPPGRRRSTAAEPPATSLSTHKDARSSFTASPWPSRQRSSKSWSFWQPIRGRSSLETKS